MTVLNLDRMKSRNDEIMKYIKEAEEKDARISENLERIFYCIREATMLLEMQKRDIKRLEHYHLQEDQSKFAQEIVAGYYSCMVMRDKLVQRL